MQNEKELIRLAGAPGWGGYFYLCEEYKLDFTWLDAVGTLPLFSVRFLKGLAIQLSKAGCG